MNKEENVNTSILNLLETFPTPKAPTSPPRALRKSTSRIADFAEILRRPAIVEITLQEQQQLYTYLISLTPSALNDFQYKTRPRLGQDIEIDNYTLIFPHYLNRFQTKSIRLKAKYQNTVKYSLIMPKVDTNFELQVDPLGGKLGGRQSEVDLVVKLNCLNKSAVVLNAVIQIEIQGGPRHFVVIKCRKKDTNKLLPPQPMEADINQRDAIFPGSSYSIPKTLVRLRLMLFAVDGIKLKGIFREAGQSWEVQALETHLKRGTYYSCADGYSIASCLKNNLKTLPSAPFLKIPKDIIYGTQSSQLCWNRLILSFADNSTEINLIMWVIDLLTTVVINEKYNEMGIKSIVTAVVPNLCDAADSAEMYLLLPAMISFMSKLVEHRLAIQTQIK
ncbi:hypothetical protein HDV01_002528 [Terramyces sp. JEL0728]|nr:hypothetical protein HDV01_002528 [Terramyces sp. JEL0728]